MRSFTSLSALADREGDRHFVKFFIKHLFKRAIYLDFWFSSAERWWVVHSRFVFFGIKQKSDCFFYLYGLREGDHCAINCCLDKLNSGRLLNIKIKLGRMVESSRCVSIVETKFSLTSGWIYDWFNMNTSVIFTFSVKQLCYNWILRFNDALWESRRELSTVPTSIVLQTTVSHALPLILISTIRKTVPLSSKKGRNNSHDIVFPN